MINTKTIQKVLIYIGLLTVLFFAVFGFFKLFVYSSKQINNSEKILKNTNYQIPAPEIPKTLDFCGESVPLDKQGIYESLDFELMKVVFWHSETMLYIKRQARVFPIVEPIFKKYNIPDDFKYLLVTESGMVNTVSPSKAEGYWQFMKATATQFGLEVNDEVDERYNLEKSTEAACKYLLSAYNKFKSWTLAAAAYNSGNDYIRKSLDTQKVATFYDVYLYNETSRYIYRILAYKLVLSDPEKYGFIVPVDYIYKPQQCSIVKVDTSIPNLIDFAKQYSTTYKDLKQLNPWLRKDKLTNKDGKTYFIKIPKQ